MNTYDRYRANKQQYEPKFNVNTSWNKHKQDYLRDLKSRLRTLLEELVNDYNDISDKELNELVVRTINEDYKRIEMLIYSFPQYKQPYEG